MVSSNAKLTKNSDFSIEKEEGSGGILINELSGEVHILNETALKIYEQCDGRLMKDIRIEYVEHVLALCKNVEREIVERDFDEIIENMISKDVLIID